jgi:hypothetical protein
MPADGVWRVGRGPDPLALRDPMRKEDLTPKTGNRFDSPLGEYSVWYFATELEACYGETLARFRPDLERLSHIDDEGFLPIGEVPADWRTRRLAVRGKVEHNGYPGPAQFLDVDHIDTRERLRVELADVLTGLGYSDLDISTVRGSDRRLTRWISDWAYWYSDEGGDFPFAGIRYCSRLDNAWECWAVFADSDIEVFTEPPRPIHRNDPDLLKVANKYGLRVF